MTPYEIAKTQVGTYEWAKGSNPVVVKYYEEAGYPEVKNDDVAWCAAFVGAMIKRAGLKPTGSLLAQSYLGWGEKVEEKDIREGDIIVFKRGNQDWQGHVTFAVSRPSGGNIRCLGGNQNDMINIATYSMKSFLGARRPPVLKPLTQSKEVVGGAVVAVGGGLVSSWHQLPEISTYAYTALSVALVAIGIILVLNRLKARKRGER